MYDVFISHASEDKDFARPLAEALQRNGLEVWFDEFTLKMGDSLRRSIDRGLNDSTYGIVILSKNFFKKDWPQKELDGLAAREVNGKKVILPIWHGVTKNDVEQYSPMLAGLLAAQTKDGMGYIVDMIMDVVRGKPTHLTVEEHPLFTDKLIRIEAEVDSFVIGKRSVHFSGISANCGNEVYVVISGPGEYSRGKQVGICKVSSSGNWSYLWTPERALLAGTYTISAVSPDKKISDDVIVKAEYGAITIVATGEQSYYIGEKIRFSGTCTTGDKVFLLLKGPNATQNERKIDQLNVNCQDGVSESFVQIDVRSDNTWSYLWDSSLVAINLEPGFYRIYAIEGPFTSDNLVGKGFGSVTIIIRPPFISAAVAQALIVNGGTVVITGTAEGASNQEVQIWIFGDSFTLVDKVYTNPDASYVYRIAPIVTKKLLPGRYFVIIQHPMMNNDFEVYFDREKKFAFSKFPSNDTILFPLQGNESPHGFDAITLLIQALDNPNCDDTYTKISFSVSNPFIKFDPIDDKKIGKKFLVIASTNLSVDEDVFIEILFSTSSSNLLKKLQTYPVKQGIVKVVSGDAGLNKISFDVDTAGLPPSELTIKASAMDIDVNTSINFKIQ